MIIIIIIAWNPYFFNPRTLFFLTYPISLTPKTYFFNPQENLFI